MARGKPIEKPAARFAERTAEQPADAGTVVVEEEMTPAEAAGFGLLSQMLGEQAVKCMLRRRNETTKKFEFQDTFPVEEFSFEMVRDVYGGGEYQVQAMAGDGHGMVKSFTFHIDARYVGKRWSQPAGATPQPAQHGGGEMAGVLAVALERMADAIRELKDVKAAPAPAVPQVDPMAMIDKLASTMRSLQPPVQDRSLSLTDQLSTAKSLVELGRNLVGDGEGGGGAADSYMGVVTKLAEPVIDLVKTRAAQEQRQALHGAPRRRALPAGNKVTATGPVPQQPSEAQPPQGAPVSWIGEIQRYIPLIVKRKQKGASATNTADFVLDELSDATLDSLAEFLSKEDSDVQLQNVLPAELKDDPQWLAEFLEAVRDYLFPEEEPVEEVEEVEVVEEEPKAGPVPDIAARAQASIAALEDNPEKKSGPKIVK